jgi:hypothetical protein
LIDLWFGATTHHHIENAIFSENWCSNSMFHRKKVNRITLFHARDRLLRFLTIVHRIFIFFLIIFWSVLIIGVPRSTVIFFLNSLKIRKLFLHWKIDHALRIHMICFLFKWADCIDHFLFLLLNR